MNTKTCYLFNSNGEFTVSLECQENPRRPGEYLLPADATFVAPPPARDGYALVWDGAGWTFVEDHRGLQYWTASKEQKRVSELGALPGDYLTDVRPVDSDSVWDAEKKEWTVGFDVLQARKVAEIRAAANAKYAELTSHFSAAEVDSWSRQEAGARLLADDPDCDDDDAVFVRSLAEFRGIALDELIEKIYAAVSLARVEGARIIGIQQRLEDLAFSATSIEGLEAIVWPQ